MASPWLIAIMGQTASGKTELAEQLADELSAQLINSDAFQVYRGLDIGTAKSPNKHKYRLIDIKDPSSTFGVGEWVRLATEALHEAYSAGRNAVVVGGSGLNVRALFENYGEMLAPPDPLLRAELNRRFSEAGLGPLVTELKGLDKAAGERIDLENPIRVIRALERVLKPSPKITFDLPPYRKAKFALDTPKEVVNSLIEARTTAMIQAGWVQEVESLVSAGYGPSTPAFRAHGYRELWSVSRGELGLDEAIESINLQVRHYAKRQRTWLRTEANLTVLESRGMPSPAKRVLDRLFALEKV